MSRIRHILAVDDDPGTRRLMQSVLSSLPDCTVSLAGSAAEAEARLEECGQPGGPPPVDLLITDVTMPGKTGIELIARIREKGLTLPVLVVSVLQAERHVPEAIAVGADDYLQKPVDIKELRATVLRLLDDQRTPSRSAQAVRIGEDAAAQVRATPEGEFVDLVLGSDAAEAERVTRIVQRVLPAATHPQVRDNIRLALEEIVRNAVEWGNQNDPSKHVRLAYCLRPDRILFRIEDEGEGFDPGGIPDPSRDPVAHVAARRAAGKRMGGWGLFLTRKMVDAITFSPRGNVVKLTTFFQPPGGGTSAT